MAAKKTFMYFLPRRKAQVTFSFRAREFCDYRCEAPRSRARHFLHADALHEVRNGKTAARARDAASRQHVVRAARIIAE